MVRLTMTVKSYGALFPTIGIGFILGYCIYKQWKNHSIKTKYGLNRLMRLNSNNQISLSLTPKPKLALVTDLDRTLVGKDEKESKHKCNQHLKKFNDMWCNKYAPQNCILIYATGRSINEYFKLIKEWDILKPDILITHDGCSIHWFNKSLAQQVQMRSTHKIDMSFDDTLDTTQFIWYDLSWEAVLSKGWSYKIAAKIHEEVHKKFDLFPMSKASTLEKFRVGVKCKGQIMANKVEKYYTDRIRDYNEESDELIDVHTFTCIGNIEKNEIWATMTPSRAGKGAAVDFLRKRLHLNEEDIICCGDSGNDLSMLKMDVNSVVVANASAVLLKFYDDKKGDASVYKTKMPKTLGVLEGLQYFGDKLLASSG